MANFKELGVEDGILRGITEMGFETATPVQEKVIPILLEGTDDLVALAQTGTGKTAAFGLPSIQKIDTSVRSIQTVILSPTRELCLQIAKDLMNYGKYVDGLKVLAVYGGTDIRAQISSLKRGVNILVATPGRLLDLINRGVCDLSHVNTVILDEADEMLNMGFKEDLNSILSETPSEKQTLLFSATMPKEVERIASNYMNNAQKITCGRKNEGSSQVTHSYYMVKAKDCYEVLRRLVDSNPLMYGIVFCRTRQDCRDVSSKLVRDGFEADALHGDLSQAQRDHVMQKFRSKGLRLLIATDVAARGLDVTDLTHVFNLNLPEDAESYTHRSGRTGRAGKKGESVAIINVKEKGKLKRIEKVINKKFEYREAPSGEDVCKFRLDFFINKLSEADVEDEVLTPFFEEFITKFEHVSKDDLIKQLISNEFTRLLKSYKNVSNINLSERDREFSRRDERDGGRNKKDYDGNFSTFAISIGRDKGLRPADVIGIINRATRSNNVEIGAIKILNDESKFEVDSAFEAEITEVFSKGAKFQGEDILINKSTSDGGERRSYGGGGDRRRSSGGDRRRSGGGERRSFGGERRSGGGDRRSSSRDGERRSSSRDGERRSYGSDNRSSAGRRDGGRSERR
ncbi:MAG: DEAD/DEAH box helicase [Marinifilaceae bacterium]